MAYISLSLSHSHFCTCYYSLFLWSSLSSLFLSVHCSHEVYCLSASLSLCISLSLTYLHSILSPALILETFWRWFECICMLAFSGDQFAWRAREQNAAPNLHLFFSCLCWPYLALDHKGILRGPEQFNMTTCYYEHSSLFVRERKQIESTCQLSTQSVL